MPFEWRPLHDPEDRQALREFYAISQDYIVLETGEAPDAATIDDFFSDAPPEQDPATCLRWGLCDEKGGIHGIVSMAFAYPNPKSSFIGLLMLRPSLRGQHYGARVVDVLKQTARDRGCDEVFIAVLDPNTRGRAFWESCGFQHELTTQPITTRSATHVRHRLRLML